jgi:ankyrin repeat protein
MKRRSRTALAVCIAAFGWTVPSLALDAGHTAPAAEFPMTALHEAAQRGQSSLVRQRLDAGAAVDLPGPRGMTPLHFAAAAGQLDVAALLLDRGADPNARAAGDMTPLHFAAMLAHPEMVGLLARRGARPDLRNASGLAPLHLAANDKVVNVLAAAGADVNALTSFGYTPLHTARQGLVARALIEQKADLRIRTPKGKTAMELAAIESLEKQGLSIHSVMLGRLRGLLGQMRVIVTNVSAEPFRDLAMTAHSEACSIDVTPTVVASLLPGQNADFIWTMTRKLSVPEGEYLIPFTLTAQGRKVGDESLKVDTHQGVTPEDQGMIRLAKGQIRPSPARWYYFVYAAAPLLVIAAWYFLRRRS